MDKPVPVPVPTPTPTPAPGNRALLGLWVGGLVGVVVAIILFAAAGDVVPGLEGSDLTSARLTTAAGATLTAGLLACVGALLVQALASALSRRA